jgi:glycosyltransferase involved in cell wall biosynthesis
MPLKIAAKVSVDDREYFRSEIEPLLDSPYVEFLGEIGERDKGAFLGQAAALLFPIQWPEPFGLTMIEALACGTPVIAHHQGSVPEVLRHGITGFIADSLDEAVQAVENLGLISREECRAQFEQRFTARRMMEDYVDVYEALLHQARSGVTTLSAVALE